MLRVHALVQQSEMPEPATGYPEELVTQEAAR